VTARSYRSPSAQAVHTDQGPRHSVSQTGRRKIARVFLAYVETFSRRLLAPCTLRSRIERCDVDGTCGVVFPLEESARGSLRIRTAPVMSALVRTFLLHNFEHRRQFTLTILLLYSLECDETWSQLENKEKRKGTYGIVCAGSLCGNGRRVGGSPGTLHASASAVTSIAGRLVGPFEELAAITIRLSASSEQTAFVRRFFLHGQLYGRLAAEAVYWRRGGVRFRSRRGSRRRLGRRTRG
jgi:hypothetical protein